MTTIKEMFLAAPSGQIDPSVLPLIAEWDDEPTSLQVLKVIDVCIYGGAASGVAVGLLQGLYSQLCSKENITHEHNVPLAVWRK